MLINADLGESWHDRTVGNDAALMPYLDQCNIACGFHGGDALTMQRTVRLALQHGVAIGAHPSYPDRRNFGREPMQLPADRLYALLVYQIGGLRELVRDAGATLNHLKPHGALYHDADRSEAVAATLCEVVHRSEIPFLVGPPDGICEQVARDRFLPYLREGFADRAYEPSLHLRSRTKTGAVLEEPEAVRDQVRLLRNGQVRATDGKVYPLRVDTLCLHGDHPGSAARARLLRELIPPRLRRRR